MELNWASPESHSSEGDTFSVVGCTNAAITVPVFGAVSLTVNSSGGFAQPGVPVYAFNGSTYSGISGTTGEDGKVALWLPKFVCPQKNKLLNYPTIIFNVRYT